MKGEGDEVFLEEKIGFDVCNSFLLCLLRPDKLQQRSEDGEALEKGRKVFC